MGKQVFRVLAAGQPYTYLTYGLDVRDLAELLYLRVASGPLVTILGAVADRLSAEFSLPPDRVRQSLNISFDEICESLIQEDGNDQDGDG